jgi:hypothetical protein
MSLAFAPAARSYKRTPHSCDLRGVRKSLRECAKPTLTKPQATACPPSAPACNSSACHYRCHSPFAHTSRSARARDLRSTASPAFASRTGPGGAGGGASRSVSRAGCRPRAEACCRQRRWRHVRTPGRPPFQKLVGAEHRRPGARPRSCPSATTGARARRPGSRRQRGPRGPGQEGPSRCLTRVEVGTLGLTGT